MVRCRERGGLCRELLPLDPAGAVPPAVPDTPVTARRVDIDALGSGRRRGGIATQLATERLPLVPAHSVPVAVPELTVGEDREHLEAGDGPCPSGRGARALP